MKTCYVCGKAINNKNEIGLNRKLLGRKIIKFYCYDCLAAQLEIEVDELMAKIEEFKNQGCALFE
jgi:hypothetical protein